MTLATIDADGVAGSSLRRARRDDLPALVEAPRRRCAPGERRQLTRSERRGPYEAAFEAIDRDPAHTLVAVEDAAGTVVATMQLTLIPGLARAGAARMQVEAVRGRGGGARPRTGHRDAALGDRRGPFTRGRPRAAHLRRAPRGRPPVLRATRVRAIPPGVQALPLTSPRAPRTGVASGRSCDRVAVTRLTRQMCLLQNHFHMSREAVRKSSSSAPASAGSPPR